MKINRLYIKNFKNISEIEIDIFKRVNVITGENGMGKSALISALGFILTNDLEEKIESYVRWGTDKFEIECEFEHEGVNYKYEIEGSKSCKKRLVISDKEEFINSEASKKLAEVIDPILTKYSAISEQGKTTQLLFQKPAERLKTIKDILKMDSIFNACENIKEDIKLKKVDIEKIEAEQVLLKGRTYSFLDEDDLRKQVEADIGIEDMIKDEEVVKKLYEKNQSELAQYKKDLDNYNNWVLKKADYDKELSSFKEKVEAYSDINLSDTFPEFDNSILIKLKEDLTAFKLKQNQYVNDLKAYNEAQKQLSAISEALALVEESLSNIVVERIPACKYNNETIAALDTNINDLSVEINEWKNKITLAKEGKCPTCGQDYKVASIEDIENSIKDIENKISNFKDQKAEQKKEIDDYAKKIDKQKEKVAVRNSLSEKKKFYEDQKSVYVSVIKPDNIDESVIEKISSDIKEQEIRQKEHDAEKNLFSCRMNDKKSIEDKISFYEKEIKNLGAVAFPEKVEVTITAFDENFYESLKKRFAIKEQKEAEYKRAIEFNSILRKEKKDNDKKIESNDKIRESLLKEINILAETRSVLEKDFSSFLIDKSITNIKDWMNAFFQQTYNKYEVTVEQDKNSVNFFYKGNEDVLTPCSMASGFERSLLAIANRVALSKIQDLGFLILDECDADASDSNSLSMFQNLTNQNQFTQFFIITHCESTKEFFESLGDAEIFEIKDGELA